MPKFFCKLEKRIVMIRQKFISYFETVLSKCPLIFTLTRFSQGEKMNTKMKSTILLSIVLIAACAMLVIGTASAVSQDKDQTKDQLRDKTQDQTCDSASDCLQDQIRDQTQDQLCDYTQDCLQDQIQLHTKLQIRDCP